MISACIRFLTVNRSQLVCKYEKSTQYSDPLICVNIMIPSDNNCYHLNNKKKH